MKHKVFAQRLFLMATVMSTLLFVSNFNISNAQTEEEEATHSEETNVVRDSQTVLLEGKTLAANDFIHIYDTTPYIIMNGHVAAKLPCDENSESPIKILIGAAPNLTAADFELLSELSTPGTACLYHVDLASDHSGNASATITDIAIQNPTQDDVSFGPSSSVVVGINEIMKGTHEAHGEGAEHAEGEGAEHAEGEGAEHAEGEEPAEEAADDTGNE
jgi:hypothetical protein